MGRADNSKVPGVVSTTYIRLLYEYIEAQGIDPVKLLTEPPPDAADLGLGRYPMARWRELLERTAEALDDPLLGLHLGQTITAAHLGTVGYVLLACANLAEAFQRMQKYMRLIYDAEPMQTRFTEAGIELEWGTGFGRPGQHVDAAAITALVEFARDMTGGIGGPSYVSFINPQPVNKTDVAAYIEYFGCPVAFEQPTTILRFPTEYLSLPLRSPDPALREILEQQAEALLQRLPETDDFEQGLRRAILNLLDKGEPTISAVAKRMHSSPRTLQRRLAERDLKYQTVLDDCRLGLAQDYLADPRLQLSEIAQLLGYSEQSAFNHAFKRWTGETPSTYTKKQY
ncbi:MAG: AraC family transcriptional regulator [Salinisphaeraceae bacterium]|nr:AraC family transcriptional regulator [Salinisphaeraceae bacterium]